MKNDFRIKIIAGLYVLAIAKNLAEANNAKISVKSKKGEGAVFIVTFSLNNGG